jgi:hypothetical protein
MVPGPQKQIEPRDRSGNREAARYLVMREQMMREPSGRQTCMLVTAAGAGTGGLDLKFLEEIPEPSHEAGLRCRTAMVRGHGRRQNCRRNRSRLR